MSKTVTLRLPDNLYDIFKKAASGERRSMPNYIEYAALSYLVDETYVSDSEMEEILKDKELVKNLNKGLKDVEEGRYRIIG
jgi:hypothetical protein